MGENPVVSALSRRARGGGSDPLLTWYRPESGARTELSVRTVANWVDKTANLLEELGAEGAVAGPVSAAHPGHWMSLVWPLAAWQRGLAYVAGAPDATCEVVVTGPEDPRAHAGLTTLACSLHPLGLGLRGLGDGVLDFSTEALAQPDAHADRHPHTLGHPHRDGHAQPYCHRIGATDRYTIANCQPHPHLRFLAADPAQ